jgi:hypothetical protein
METLGERKLFPPLFTVFFQQWKYTPARGVRYHTTTDFEHRDKNKESHVVT